MDNIKRDILDYRLYSDHNFDHYIKDMGVPEHLKERHKAVWDEVNERFD